MAAEKRDEVEVEVEVEVIKVVNVVKFLDINETNGIEIEGTLGMAYLTDNRIGSDLEYFLATLIDNDSNGVIGEAMLRLRKEWFEDANSAISIAIEKHAAKMFNNIYYHYDSSVYQQHINLTENEIVAVEAIYNVTQKLLLSKNVKSLVAYRGLYWENQPPGWESLCEGDTIRFKQRTLSSWSLDRDQAEIFAADSGCEYQLVLKATFFPEQIFSIINNDICLENESIYINRHDEDICFEIIFKYGGELHE